MKIEWVAIPGYEGIYDVSSTGLVRRLTDRLSRPRRYPLILKQHLGKDGYPRVGLWRAGRQHGIFVHTLVLKAFVGQRPDGMECRHKDNNKTNNFIVNLEWTTPEINKLDKIKFGTMVRGEKQRHSVLTGDNVVEIRKLRTSGMRTIAISKIFRVRPSTISSVVRRKTWVHIP